MILDYFALALGSLRHRGLRSWLTMLGIFIGIAAVVSLISLGQGLQTAISNQFSVLSTDILTIQNTGTGFGPPGSTAPKKLTEHDVNLIKSVYGISEVVSRLIRAASFEYNGVREFSFVGSIPKDQKQVDFIYQTQGIKVDSGKLLKSDDKGKVFLGSDFANKNEFGKEIKVGSKVLIQGKEFTVIGIMKKSSSFILNGVILMSEDEMKSLLDIGDEIDLIAAQVQDKNKIEDIASEIEKKLRKDRNEKVGEEDFSVTTPLQNLETVSLILNIINIIVTGIAAISLLVGGIGITNAMFTSVLERTKEIGTMKAVGAKNSDILYIFLIESGLLGMMGGVIGALMGLGFAFGASSIANQAFGSSMIEVTISYPLLFAAIGFAFFIGIISGIVPAIQASRLKPVEALRK